MESITERWTEKRAVNGILFTWSNFSFVGGLTAKSLAVQIFEIFSVVKSIFPLCFHSIASRSRLNLVFGHNPRGSMFRLFLEFLNGLKYFSSPFCVSRQSLFTIVQIVRIAPLCNSVRGAIGEAGLSDRIVKVL